MARQSGRSERQAFWLEHLRACANGSLKAYAQANGLDVRELYGAKARLKRQGLLPPARPHLVRVERAEAEATPAALCRVHLRNGTSVEVACAPQHWPALLASVAALP
jgi:hypothetical protein